MKAIIQTLAIIAIGSLIIIATSFVVHKFKPDLVYECYYNDETVVGTSVEIICYKK